MSGAHADENAALCEHANVRTTRSLPPLSRCLDCEALVERRWVGVERDAGATCPSPEAGHRSVRWALDALMRASSSRVAEPDPSFSCGVRVCADGHYHWFWETVGGESNV